MDCVCPTRRSPAPSTSADDTVTNYIKLQRDEGLGGLVENRYYKPTSSVEQYLGQIELSFTDKPVATASEGAERIESISGNPTVDIHELHSF